MGVPPVLGQTGCLPHSILYLIQPTYLTARSSEKPSLVLVTHSAGDKTACFLAQAAALFDANGLWKRTLSKHVRDAKGDLIEMGAETVNTDFADSGGVEMVKGKSTDINFMKMGKCIGTDAKTLSEG